MDTLIGDGPNVVASSLGYQQRHLAENSEIKFNHASSQMCLIQGPGRQKLSPLFNGRTGLQVACLVLITLAFMGPVVYIIRNRKAAQTSARSPWLSILQLVLLMGDALLNTVIFSVTLDDERGHRRVCLLAIWTTMLFNIPILIIMFLRVYRVKRVFELYEQYLLFSRATLGDQIVNRQSRDVVSQSKYALRYSSNMLMLSNRSEFHRLSK